MKLKTIRKIVVASLLGTVFEIIGFVFIGYYTIIVFCAHFVEVPLMVLYVLGKERHHLFKVIGYGYFFMIMVNGVLEVLWIQFGEQGSYLFYIAFSCSVVMVGVRMWKNYTDLQKGIIQVQLLHHGKQILTKGFYDSGNCLKDPYTAKGVHIISFTLWEKFEGIGKAPVYVPYHALGNEMGMLEVYYIEEIILEGKKGRILIKNSPVGVTKDNLFEGKKYEIILNEEVF